MATLTIIIVYLVGVVISYLFNRWIYSDEWTISLRTRHILLSLLSWIYIYFMLVLGLIKYYSKCLNNHNKAKW